MHGFHSAILALNSCFALALETYGLKQAVKHLWHMDAWQNHDTYPFANFA